MALHAQGTPSVGRNVSLRPPMMLCGHLQTGLQTWVRWGRSLETRVWLNGPGRSPDTAMRAADGAVIGTNQLVARRPSLASGIVPRRIFIGQCVQDKSGVGDC